MDKLPECLLLDILSRLDNSADVARCRVASKAFNTVFPDLRSINLVCSRKWLFKKVFLDIISKLRVVESVCICLDDGIVDVDLAHGEHQSNVLLLISKYCHNLATLTLYFARVSDLNPMRMLTSYLNPMRMLTSLKLVFTILEDQHVNEFNKCFPNLQVLNLLNVKGLLNPKIHLLILQTCHLVLLFSPPSLTLITPNLISLRIECSTPMLSNFHLNLNALKHTGAFTAKKFENLKTLWMDFLYIDSLLSEFPITKTVENLTLNSGNKASRDARDSKLTLWKVFTIFPNLSSLCIKSGAWSELEACLNPEGWEILDGRKGLKTICAYLMLVDPLLTFSYVACVLDQCEGLSVVSLLIHSDFGTQCESFMSKCMARWPGLKWRWGIWGEDMEDTWITDINLTERHKSSKKLHL